MFSKSLFVCKRILKITVGHISAILEEQLPLFFFMGAITLSLLIAVSFKLDKQAKFYHLNSDSPNSKQECLLTSNSHNVELIINNSPFNHE